MQELCFVAATRWANPMESVVVEFFPTFEAHAARRNFDHVELGAFAHRALGQRLERKLKRLVDDLGHIANAQCDLRDAFSTCIDGRRLHGIKHTRNNAHLMHVMLPDLPHALKRGRPFSASLLIGLLDGEILVVIFVVRALFLLLLDALGKHDARNQKADLVKPDKRGEHEQHGDGVGVRCNRR